MIDMHMFISTTPQFQETSENLSLFQTPGTQSHEAITSSLGQKKIRLEGVRTVWPFWLFFAGVVIFVGKPTEHD